MRPSPDDPAEIQEALRANADAPASGSILDPARVDAAVARIDRIATALHDAPTDAPIPELRAALAHGSVPDALLASSALQLLRGDHKSSVAPALVNLIEDNNRRYEAARACTQEIIAMGSDKWAFKFALALQDEFPRLTCALAAIAYIVELGIRSYAASCLNELRRVTHASDYEDDFFTHALFQRGGRPLVERWLGWQHERAERIMQGMEAREAATREKMTEE